MLQETLIQLFERDLSKLIQELEAYNIESNMWLSKDSINNSAGNLALHIVGNLNAFIGAEIGNTGYIRQRELEFSLKDVPRSEIIAQIMDTQIMIKETLTKVTDEDLQKEYPKVVFKAPMATEYFLIHLSTHLTYHLGQINYHRRLLEK